MRVRLPGARPMCTQHPNQCSGHLSQCFTPKHQSLLQPKLPWGPTCGRNGYTTPAIWGSRTRGQKMGKGGDTVLSVVPWSRQKREMIRTLFAVAGGDQAPSAGTTNAEGH